MFKANCTNCNGSVLFQVSYAYANTYDLLAIVTSFNVTHEIKYALTIINYENGGLYTHLPKNDMPYIVNNLINSTSATNYLSCGLNCNMASDCSLFVYKTNHNCSLFVQLPTNMNTLIQSNQSNLYYKN